MKKIYAGDQLASVILDSDEEIEDVTRSLIDAVHLLRNTPATRELRDAYLQRANRIERMVIELDAPAPGAKP